jgi:NAD(P)-dependent dehydrogenase (short-subunit alcohol dehydrogenase family)
MVVATIDERVRDCYATTDVRKNKELASQLHGKNVVIFGAGRGIGQTFAEFFSHCTPKSISVCALEQDEVDRVAEACRGIDGSIATKTRALDVRDAAAVKAFIEDVVKSNGSIDIAIMNAGRPPQWLPLSEGSPDLWWHSVEVGIRGSYNMARYALPIMQAQHSGTVIFTASAGAHGNAGYSAYTTAKLAMVRLAEIVHAENFREHNIKAFAVSPGAVPTRMYTDFRDAAAGKKVDGSYVVESAEGEEKSVKIAMEHFGHIKQWDTPEMSAGMVAVLCSGQLDFLSGRFVDCAIKVEKYLQEKQTILEEDLYRIRLNAGTQGLLPRLEY